ncbi:MAG: amino acid adenylation domain-containing protein [Cytophagaceae bacterium]|nr:amino acid adenylation domain-containing protein [Cytophagaceae bacterium]MDW8455443.1 amino acid adenylation domain-containing protein [Cytophagaceae bacterium]
MNPRLLKEELENLSAYEREKKLNVLIRQWLAEFLYLDSADDIAPDQAFAELGTSSTEAVSFKILLEKKIGIPLRTTLLFDYPNIPLLTDFLLQQLPLKNLTETQICNSSGKEHHSESTILDDDPVVIIAAEGIFPDAGNAQILWQKISDNSTLLPEVIRKYHFAPIKENQNIVLNSFDDDKNIPDSRPLRLILQLFETILKQLNITAKHFKPYNVGLFTGSSHSVTLEGCEIPLSQALAYHLNYTGPCETFNSYCVSSYAALHYAVQSISKQECTYAWVGAVNCIDPDKFASTSLSPTYKELLSPTFCTRSFSAFADGYVPAEGAGVLLLTTLSHAQRHKLPVRAIVRATSLQHGGRSFSIKAPNGQAMENTILKCLQQAGIPAHSIDYIEAHGIGNPLADALELNALHRAYRKSTGVSGHAWHISSIKPTIGHLEVASGIASIIKAIYSIEHHTLPGNPLFDTLTTDAGIIKDFVFNKHIITWKSSNSPRRVGLNSYAVGGMNAHVILEEYTYHAASFHIDKHMPVHHEENYCSDVWQKFHSKTKEILSEVFSQTFGEDITNIDFDLPFAAYGLNSLKAMQFAKLLNERLNVRLRPAQILSSSNFYDFFALLFDELDKPSVAEKENLSFTNDRDVFPVSYVQKGLWYIQQTNPDSTIFNVPICFELNTSLSISTIKKALLHILEKYPVLRVNFFQDTSTEALIQKVGATPKDVIIEEKHVPQEVTTNEFLFSLLRIPFSLEKELPIRVYYIHEKQHAKEYLFFVVHHIVMDGISGVEFIKSFWQYYNSISADLKIAPVTRDTDFFHYVLYETEYMKSNRAKEDLLWWKDYLKDIPEQYFLPYEKLPTGDSYSKHTDCLRLTLKDETFDKLVKTAVNLNCNLSTLILSLFYLLLNKITQQKDICLTTPVAGRPLARYNTSVGCFINLIVTRVILEADEAFSSFVQKVKLNFTDAISHADFPFPSVVAELNLKKGNNTSALPLSFTYQNFFDEWEEQCPPLCYDIYQESDDHYTFEVYERKQSLEIYFKYKRELFNKKTIEQHGTAFSHLMQQIMLEPAKPLKDYELLPEQIKREILEIQKGPSMPLPPVEGIHQLIEAKCAERPHSPAIIYQNKKLTYEMLEHCSRQVALFLQKEKTVSEEKVGIYLPSSPEAIIAILGVLRAGATYVPLDVKNPIPRIEAIIRQAEIKRIITTTNIADNIKKINSSLNVYDIHHLYETNSETALQNKCKSNHLAYVLFTSGSTGDPKGVMIEHRSLINLALGMIKTYDLTAKDRILQFAPLSFDMSVEEIFPALCCGACLIIREEDDIDPFRFLSLVTNQKITVLNLVPSYVETLQQLKQDDQKTLFQNIRVLALGGEPLQQKLLDWAQQFPIRIFNAYGPAECTVNVAIAELTSDKCISIGKPFYNTQLYVLSSEGELLPQGSTGELCVSGFPVGRGYLNSPGLTEKKFIPNPYGTGNLYKTGDKVRLRHDGTIEYSGRIDDQFKIRGFRIEPAEIEKAMANKQGIRQVVILPHKKENSLSVVAFYTCDEGPVNEGEWRNFLKNKIPDYMIPSLFIYLSQMPLTTNAKIDRKKLLEYLNEDLPLSDGKSKHPDTSTEKIILSVWQEVLRENDISIEDNFFQIGGHSLQAIQIVLRISNIFQTNFSLREFYMNPTIRECSSYIENIVSPQLSAKEYSMVSYYENSDYIVV